MLNFYRLPEYAGPCYLLLLLFLNPCIAIPRRKAKYKAQYGCTITKLNKSCIALFYVFEIV